MKAIVSITFIVLLYGINSVPISAIRICASRKKNNENFPLKQNTPSVPEDFLNDSNIIHTAKNDNIKFETCTNFCHALWQEEKTANGTKIIILSQGCWKQSGEQKCETTECIALQSSTKALNNTKFCCCHGDYCNLNINSTNTLYSENNAHTSISAENNQPTTQQKTVTIQELVKNFPCLDYVNMEKRNPICGPVDPTFPRIEAIVLFSEPISWETPLQLIIDLLMTNGMPIGLLDDIPYPHIPILACNMDLLWVSEAPIPRYGHGTFLLCLESLYKKITGKDMIYTALIGKPSEITYYHANYMLHEHAKSIGIDNVNTIYAIGDNINTDIFGANLYDKYLSYCAKEEALKSDKLKKLLDKDIKPPNAKACISILVETGVHQRDSDFISEHSPRDFLPVEDGLGKPAFVVKHVGEAINVAFKEEKFD